MSIKKTRQCDGCGAEGDHFKIMIHPAEVSAIFVGHLTPAILPAYIIMGGGIKIELGVILDFCDAKCLFSFLDKQPQGGTAV